MDYYRGKVKSVYEKEPCFKDFVRNIPLSESNVYDMNNLSRLKRRFQSMVSDRWGRDSTPDPLKPSRVRQLETRQGFLGSDSMTALRHCSLLKENSKTAKKLFQRMRIAWMDRKTH